MTPADQQVIHWIRRSNARVRAALLALARAGKAMVRDEPERARSLLDAVFAHPIYKALRVQFDLLEIEDLMLDVPMPVDLGGWASESSTMARLASILVTALSAPNAAPNAQELLKFSELARDPSMPAELPPLEGWPELLAADYLYDLVVLGVLRLLAKLAQAGALGEQTEAPAAT
jgi:hypothetical protein